MYGFFCFARRSKYGLNLFEEVLIDEFFGVDAPEEVNVIPVWVGNMVAAGQVGEARDQGILNILIKKH